MRDSNFKMVFSSYLTAHQSMTSKSYSFGAVSMVQSKTTIYVLVLHSRTSTSSLKSVSTGLPQLILNSKTSLHWMTNTLRHSTQFKVFSLEILIRFTLTSFQKSLKVMIMMQHRIMPNLLRREILLLALKRRTQMQALSPETLLSSIVCKLQFTLLKMIVILCQKAL